MKNLTDGANMKEKTNLIRYREIYTYLNEDTLKVALENDHGNLLLGMLRENLNRVSVGCILMALGESLKAEYIQLLWHYTKNEDPYIRESAYIALICFPDEDRPQYDYFLNKFKNNLITEKSDGVIKTMENCIECLEREIHWRAV